MFCFVTPHLCNFANSNLADETPSLKNWDSCFTSCIPSKTKLRSIKMKRNEENFVHQKKLTFSSSWQWWGDLSFHVRFITCGEIKFWKSWLLVLWFRMYFWLKKCTQHAKTVHCSEYHLDYIIFFQSHQHNKYQFIRWHRWGGWFWHNLLGTAWVYQYVNTEFQSYLEDLFIYHWALNKDKEIFCMQANWRTGITLFWKSRKRK